jgi:hypothetical protein
MKRYSPPAATRTAPTAAGSTPRAGPQSRPQHVQDGPGGHGDASFQAPPGLPTRSGCLTPNAARPPPTDRTTSADYDFAPSIPALAVAVLGCSSRWPGRPGSRGGGDHQRRLTVTRHDLRACRAHPAAPWHVLYESFQRANQLVASRQRPHRMSEADEPAEAMCEGLKRGSTPNVVSDLAVSRFGDSAT